MQDQRTRLDLRDHPDDWAAGAAITAYDGTTWGDHGESDPAYRDEPHSPHSGPGQVRVEYHDEFAKGSPFLLSLEGPWGLDATASMTIAEADNLRRMLEIMLLDADPMWHLHNAQVEDETRGER